jgi:hypothetical protein
MLVTGISNTIRSQKHSYRVPLSKFELGISSGFGTPNLEARSIHLNLLPTMRNRIDLGFYRTRVEFEVGFDLSPCRSIEFLKHGVSDFFGVALALMFVS